MSMRSVSDKTKSVVPKIRLSEEQIENFKKLCDHGLANALDNSKLTAHNFTWEQCKRRDFVTSFRGIKKREKVNCRFYRSVGTVEGCMEEMVQGCITTNDIDFKYVCKALADDFEDGAILYEIEGPSETRPMHQISIKWQCFRPSFYVSYDVCYLEYTGTTYDNQGNLVGFNILQSVDIPEFRQYGKYKRLLITEISNMYQDSLEKGRVDISRTAYLINRATANWIFDAIGLERSFDMIRYVKYIETVRYTSADFVSEANWVPDACRADCFGCERKFGPFRGKHHCRRCGDIFCSKCLMKKSVRFKNVLREVKICMDCVMEKRKAAFAPRISRTHSVVSSAQGSSCASSLATTVNDEEGDSFSDLMTASSLPSVSCRKRPSSSRSNDFSSLKDLPEDELYCDQSSSFYQRMELSSQGGFTKKKASSFDSAFLGLQSSIAEQDRILRQMIKSQAVPLEPSDRIVELK